MGKTKLKIFVIAIVMSLTAFVSTSTLAYFQNARIAANVVTSGNIQFIIHEMTDQGKEFPKEGVYVIPGDIVSKEVTIESDCGHPFYLRVKMIYGVSSEELSAEDCFKLNINTEHWELHDGWYYYKNVVEPGQTTPYVFSHVEMVGSKISTNYIGKVLTLTVKAQAVQSENNPIEDGKTYTASGWPAE